MVATPLDAAVRQQIFTEGVKLRQSEDFTLVLRDVREAIFNILGRLEINKLSELEFPTFQRLVSRVKKAVSDVLSRWIDRFWRFSRSFLNADVALSTVVFAALADAWDDGAEGPEEEDRDLAPLWALFGARPLAATGLPPREQLRQFADATARDIGARLSIGFMDGKTVKEVQSDIVGTRSANFRDGILAAIKRRADAVTSSIIQHARSIVNNFFGPMFASEYEWVSVIDSKTSDICRSRNGRVYAYGAGPMPPAHPNCRSTTRPVFRRAPAAPVPTWGDWLRSQPVPVQNEILGRDKAVSFRKGEKVPEAEKYNPRRSLTVKDYEATTKTILT